MPARVFHRDNCRLCLSKSVELVVGLKPVPLAEKYCSTADAGQAVERFPIDLYICRACGHVQLLDVIDSDTLWDDYTYFSGQTKGIVDHMKDVARHVIDTYQPPKGSLIIDIGSNDGSLLRPFKEAGYKVLGIDPAKEIAKQATASGIQTLPELMSEELATKIRQEYGPAAIVTAFNVFAHADDLNSMARSIQNMLAPDGVFVFECQYLLDIVDKLLLGTIFHEHMSHHSLKPMVRFLAKNGLEMVDVQRNSIQQGSIVGFAQHARGPRAKQSTVAELLDLEEARKLDTAAAVRVFGEKLENLRSQIGKLLEHCQRTGATVAGFGAARSGPTIVAQFGLGSAIQYVFDDHPMKTHKFTPGDGFEVVPTTELLKRQPDYVFILAWIHAKKIIESNPEYLRRGGKFVVCFPEMQIVDASSPLLESTPACAAVS